MDNILRLRDYIYDKTGMYFPDGRRYFFEGQILKRMEALGMPSVAKYFNYLQSGDNHEALFGQLVNEVTVSESTFFGDQRRLRALKDIFLPNIINIKRQNENKKVRIWSVGCSSGEEAYVAAMIVHQLKTELDDDWDLRIWATDTNIPLLEKAKRGVYEEFTTRGIPDSFREEYLVPSFNGINVSEEIKPYIFFEQVGLNDHITVASAAKKIDLIICSNILIRYDFETRREIVQQFQQCLTKGGYLILGYYESLHDLESGFNLVHFPGGIGYRKSLKG